MSLALPKPLCICTLRLTLKKEYTTKLSQVSSQNSNGEKTLSTQEQIKIFTEVVGGPKKGVIYRLVGQPYIIMHGYSSSSRWSSPMEWESERMQLVNRMNEMQSSFEASINDMQSSFKARVEAAVEERVASEVEERVAAAMEERVEAALEERISSIEARFMTRFASFERGLPKSPLLHQ